MEIPNSMWGKPNFSADVSFGQHSYLTFQEDFCSGGSGIKKQNKTLSLALRDNDIPFQKQILMSKKQTIACHTQDTILTDLNLKISEYNNLKNAW